jgi:mono/diheme cytochrome c family protein
LLEFANKKCTGKAEMLMDLLVKRLNLAAATITMVLVLFLIQSRPPVMGAPADDAAGLFKAKCVACHGSDASGNTPVGKNLKIRDLRSAEVQAQSDAELFKIISNGKGKMPAYSKSLTEEQIHQLVAFIREQGKKH